MVVSLDRIVVGVLLSAGQKIHRLLSGSLFKPKFCIQLHNFTSVSVAQMDRAVAS